MSSVSNKGTSEKGGNGRKNNTVVVIIAVVSELPGDIHVFGHLIRHML